MDYTYSDFIDTLDETCRAVFRIIHEYITDNYPEYKPFDIRHANKSAEWTLNYRKRPKTGKTMCTLQSHEGKLSIRFCFLSSMTHEFLMRQDEFSSKTKGNVLRQLLCSVGNACRCYGGNTPCPWRQNFWVDHRLMKTCPYPWIYFDGLTENDFADIKLLIDLQTNNMTQNSKDIKGGTYAAENLERCGNIRIASLERADLDVDVKIQAQLEKYTRLYNLIPMGENGGLWFFHGRGAPGYFFTEIPEGRYAVVTINDPLKFSANRVWNYICEWLAKEKQPIREINLDAQTSAVCFARFSIDNDMQMLVPVEG